MEELQIKYGKYKEYEDAEKNFNDIVFFTDVPVIRARGVTYGGNGVPTWDGESKTYSDPVQLFKELYSRLKKSMYMADTNCPKFDIYIDQVYGSVEDDYRRKDGWMKDTTGIPHVYKMRYDDNGTTFAHFTNKYTAGQPVRFTFPVKKGTRFQIHPCAEKDWLTPNGDHERMCPQWDNDINAYAMTYGYSFVEEASQKYLTQVSDTDQIYVENDGTVVLTYLFGSIVMNENSKKKYPKISIGFVPGTI